MSLFQSILRKQIRTLPKILKSVKITHYYSLLFIRVLNDGNSCTEEVEMRVRRGHGWRRPCSSEKSVRHESLELTGKFLFFLFSIFSGGNRTASVGCRLTEVEKLKMMFVQEIASNERS